MPNSHLNQPIEGYDPAVSYIGLFGTCGTTTWRRDFIQTFDDLAIAYYNPQVAEWTPELAKLEARHLISDDIILFPVTGQTYGTGSLAETGFSIGYSDYRVESDPLDTPLSRR